MKQGEKSKRESFPWVKREKSPGLKNRTIQSRKQRKFGSLLVSTLLDVFFLSFSPLPLCCRITRAQLHFSPYQSGQSSIGYNNSWLIERFSIAFTANGKCQAEISRLPKTREIYLVSAYILPVSHRYGASTKNREIS